MLFHDLIELQPKLLRLVGDDEDALQDVNLRLLARADSIRDPDRYAARTAKRYRLDAARRAKRRNGQPRVVTLPADARVPDHRSSTPVEVACAAKEHERLHSAIAQLPPRQRRAIENPCRGSNSNRYKALRRLRAALGSNT